MHNWHHRVRTQSECASSNQFIFIRHVIIVVCFPFVANVAPIGMEDGTMTLAVSPTRLLGVGGTIGGIGACPSMGHSPSESAWMGMSQEYLSPDDSEGLLGGNRVDGVCRTRRLWRSSQQSSSWQSSGGHITETRLYHTQYTWKAPLC